MAFVAAAIGGSAAIGAGASIYGSLQQKKAAKQGMNAQQDALNMGIRTQEQGKQQALDYLDPFRQYGLNAGSTLQSMLYSPDQLAAQQGTERARMQGELEALQKKKITFDQWHNQYGAQYTGGKGLKRSRSAYSQFDTKLNNQIQAAEAQLNTFNKQSEAQQQFAGQAQDVQASPWYQFQADLLNRGQDRAMAARGLIGSGFEAEERRKGLIQLGAQETENQFARLSGMYNIGANATAQGAGVITGAAQQIAGLQGAQGQVQAQGYQTIAGANAGMATGIANSVNGAIGTGLNYMQFQNLINANKPPAPVGGANPNVNAYG